MQAKPGASDRPRGRFVSLEGPDGAGKSVVTRAIADALASRALSVTVVREPGGTPLGEAIRAILMDAGLHHSGPADAMLFNAARAELVAQVIGPSLERGGLVICDRYADSTLAYQGYGSGVDMDALRALEALSTGGLRPDRTVLFDVPVEVGLERRRRGPGDQKTRFEDEGHHDRAFHERVRAGYLAMADGDPRRWRVVDATLGLDDLVEAVRVALCDLVPELSGPAGS